MSEDAVKQIVEDYVAACQAADAEKLKAVFHTNAIMMGYMQGTFLTGGPDPFIDMVADSEPCTYEYSISEVSVVGDVGSARLDEENYMEMNFTDYFHVARSDEGWKIVGKVFQIREQ